MILSTGCAKNVSMKRQNINMRRRTMQIELEEMKENDDGSATCTLKLDQEGVRYLINLGFVHMLKKVVDEYPNLLDTEDEQQ
jgi:hypothetical protein